MRQHLTGAVLLAALAISACAPTGSGDGETVKVVIGYQSKTINTVTAGTLLRDRKYFEDRLADIGRGNGKKYEVVWQDYESGAPITAQMVAEKIDIGSMGDYPLLINGSKTKDLPNSRTELIGFTGYNLKGALNSVVVPLNSTATTLADLKGKQVSTSVGSAAHGLLVRALEQAKLPKDAVTVINQQPSVGASALQAGSVQALSQFVAWPGQLVFRNEAKLLYDGSQLNFPTLHGIVARKAYTDAHPEVTRAFLAAVKDATGYLHEKPLGAAQLVATATGQAPEVVYLYNGPNGIVTFDPTLKPRLITALVEDVPFLTSINVLDKIDVPSFVKDSYLRESYGADYDKDTASLVNKAAITGTDANGQAVTDPATASEVWFDGEQATVPAATPAGLLKIIAKGDKKVRVAYVPDAVTGTRWFADRSVWVDEPGAGLKPFTTRAAADTYATAHPGSTVLDYAAALAKS